MWEPKRKQKQSKHGTGEKEQNRMAKHGRLIDADALMKCIPREETSSRFAVANAPTVEPERKTGKWIHDGFDIPHGVDWIHCSECGRREPNVPAAKTPYCPNCGARMEEGEADD